jgi:hypothetical protein
LVNQTYTYNDYTYSEGGVTKTIKNGFFVPIFLNNNKPLGNDRNDYYINKMKEIKNLIDTNPYSYIFDGGYIKTLTSILGVGEHRTVVSHKKPSLNTAILLSKKPLAIEFWNTLTWNGMSDELKTLSEKPLPDS